jgi:hypothetical protein
LFEVAVRGRDGSPSVIANAPFLDDGTPMPIRYWLVDAVLRAQASRLEAAGGVRRSEAVVDLQALAAVHPHYAVDRDLVIPPGYRGPRLSRRVGGTRKGVNCFHAHSALWLDGAEDPVGDWVAGELGLSRPGEGDR